MDEFINEVVNKLVEIQNLESEKKKISDKVQTLKIKLDKLEILTNKLYQNNYNYDFYCILNDNNEEIYSRQLGKLNSKIFTLIQMMNLLDNEFALKCPSYVMTFKKKCLEVMADTEKILSQYNNPKMLTFEIFKIKFDNFKNKI